jgi:hypothetical protein
MLKQSIDAAGRAGVIEQRSLDTVVIDTMRSMPGAPCDGHTLHSQLEQVEILISVRPALALADRGYRGIEPATGTRLLLSHTRRLPPKLKKLLRRRQAINDDQLFRSDQVGLIPICVPCLCKPRTLPQIETPTHVLPG